MGFGAIVNMYNLEIQMKGQITTVILSFYHMSGGMGLPFRVFFLAGPED
jgi:hypothetical protein